MSGKSPNQSPNDEKNPENEDKTSERYRSNSSFNGSLNFNIRSLGINTRVTFGNRSSTSRDARSISRGSTRSRAIGHGPACRYGGSDDAAASGCGCHRSDTEKFEGNSRRSFKNQRSMDHDESYGSPFGRTHEMQTGTRPKTGVLQSPRFGDHYNDMTHYQATPLAENTQEYYRNSMDYYGNFRRMNDTFNDALTESELDFVFENTEPNVPICTGLDDLVYSTGDVTKRSDGTYNLNGMNLSLEELEFILDQSSPSDNARGSTMTNYDVQYSGFTSVNYTDADKSGQAREQLSNNGDNRQTEFRRRPVTSAEKLLASSSQEVLELPWAEDEDLSKCPICLASLHSDSPAQTSPHKSRGLVGAAMLVNCGHIFHCCCLLPLLATAPESFTCPLCRTPHGSVTGTQPPGGTMRTSLESFSLPGFEPAKTIVISYQLPEGVQGPGHPHPGQPYLLKGFPRKAYLPDTAKGRQVALLLKKAFDRRLVFTVGHSESLDLDDCVVWGNISHKTLVRDKKFGYPDPRYLDTVMLELAALGVVEA